MRKQPNSGEKTMWKRICPKCGKQLFYARKSKMILSERKNRSCISCSLLDNTHCRNRIPWNKGLTRETSDVVKNLAEKVAVTLKGRKRPLEITAKIIASRKGYRHSAETRRKMGLSNTGKVRSPETRKKQSEAAIRRIQRYKLYNKPNFNPSACEFIEALNYSMGFKFQHALNGGEVWVKGYYPDGYDKEKNILFEYDEPWHNTEKRRAYDYQKSQIMINALRPRAFIRYDCENKRLYDAITNVDIPTNIPFLYD